MSDNDNLEKEKILLTTKINGNNEKSMELKDNLGFLTSTLNEAQKRIEDLKTQMEKFYEFKKKSELYDELNKELTASIIAISKKLPGMFDDNNEKLGRLQNNINVMKSNFNEFTENQNKKMDSENQSLKDENDRLKADLNDLNNKKSQLEDDYKKVTKEKEEAVRDFERKNTELKHKEEDFSNLNEKYEQLCDDIEKLNNSKKLLLDKQEQIKTQLNGYEKLNIDKLKEAHTLLVNFTKQTRDNLRSVFPTDSFLGFISDGMQWERIAGIWEQTKRMIINESTYDINNMRRLFNILFDVFNEGYIEKPYILIIPKVGSKYDINEQIIKNNKPDGIINEVLLEGYISTKNNAVHKAVVTVN